MKNNDNINIVYGKNIKKYDNKNQKINKKLVVENIPILIIIVEKNDITNTWTNVNIKLPK